MFHLNNSINLARQRYQLMKKCISIICENENYFASLEIKPEINREIWNTAISRLTIFSKMDESTQSNLVSSETFAECVNTNLFQVRKYIF